MDDRTKSNIIYEYLAAEPSAIIKEEYVAASLKPSNTTGLRGLEARHLRMCPAELKGVSARLCQSLRETREVQKLWKFFSVTRLVTKKLGYACQMISSQLPPYYVKPQGESWPNASPAVYSCWYFHKLLMHPVGYARVLFVVLFLALGLISWKYIFCYEGEGILTLIRV